ncbi:hypothetical protein COU19_01045 [Candidatus Kaiserbacteria bacterium CG10_big_fil_rev_8_21_14_0_10_56_12]|uniref:Glutamate/phenylalanine/leucine/valine/L-tryptophan dehydrogenase C-terminal domain-containing protein n=1 Tax=Candidatus Kaiserbacteria bacterium CG10_big_fil_rev_8_21_14_0_10_56_12 TaxID=1974611 RepID=A0A2H0UC08_9BACT|nr:MAG: hypothetical protein COU19_01045 [Candidatus Kaiserbacteria bacterium CG10_big_fil_rev_8_21_14_0_10_56_12]
MIAVEGLPEFDEHELIARIFDKKTGLRGYIAIHNTTTGVAVGGTRFAHYESEEDALRDALRLSRAMTYKCALAGVPYGGGKAVLIAAADAKGSPAHKSKEYLQAYAGRLSALAAVFYTGEDVGITEEDIVTLSTLSKNIIGRPSVGGLPAHWAAQSVYRSIQAALQHVYGSECINGRTIAIKGLGNVGINLAKMLYDAGAQIIAAEIDEGKARQATHEMPGIILVSPDEIMLQEMDVFAPCALGGDLSPQTISKLSAKIVCGAANNQLTTASDGDLLKKEGITYVPDYIANAGGLITVVDELHDGGYNRARVAHRVDDVKKTVKNLLEKSDELDLPPSRVADDMVQKLVSK